MGYTCYCCHGNMYRNLHLVYELIYYTSSVVISAADPISDIIVALLYLSDDKTVFGVCTLAICLIPGLLLAALSFQWVIYDTTLASMLKELTTLDKYHAPKDYTQYFIEGKDSEPLQVEDEKPDILPLPVTRHEDVLIHPPETMDTVEVDATPGRGSFRQERGTKRRERNISEISVDAGLSKYPLIITGGTIERKDAYKKTCQELQIAPVKPSWSCTTTNVIGLLFHIIGLPGVPRYTALFLQALRIHRKRRQLNEKYELFVKEATDNGIKEVYFDKDLLELYHGRRDAALLRLVEGALEATPQLLLQLYIIVKHTRWETNWFTYVSVAFSFTSVTWSMTSYIYEHRAASYDKGSMTLCNYMITVLIKFFMCLSRISAILLAATYSGYVVMGVLVSHWITCLIYVCIAKTHFYGGLVWNEWFFKFISSITLILTFMNIIEGNSRLRWMVYHTFILLQNLGMLLFWYFSHYTDPSSPDWYGLMCISIVVGGMVMGSLLSLLYYQCMHPSQANVLELKEIEPILELLKRKYTSTNREETFETSL